MPETGRAPEEVWLGDDLDSAELAEMFVESKGGLDSQPLHHHAAYAVRETPRLILVRPEHFPSAEHVFRQDLFHLDNLLT
jgi:hypothetical protein